MKHWHFLTYVHLHLSMNPTSSSSKRNWKENQRQMQSQLHVQPNMGCQICYTCSSSTWLRRCSQLTSKVNNTDMKAWDCWNWKVKSRRCKYLGLRFTRTCQTHKMPVERSPGLEDEFFNDRLRPRIRILTLLLRLVQAFWRKRTALKICFCKHTRAPMVKLQQFYFSNNCNKLDDNFNLSPDLLRIWYYPSATSFSCFSLLLFLFQTTMVMFQYFNTSQNYSKY